jgi:hypothetical protein
MTNKESTIGYGSRFTKPTKLILYSICGWLLSLYGLKHMNTEQSDVKLKRCKEIILEFRIQKRKARIATIDDEMYTH